MGDLILIIGLSIIGLVGYLGVTGKFDFSNYKKNSKSAKQKSGNSSTTQTTKMIEGDFLSLIGVVGFQYELLEIKTKQGHRKFTGAIKTLPINYYLRSYDEQMVTDNNFEELLARLNLGPGREVDVSWHIQSRPIELVDQLQPYYDNFPNLSSVAQRFANDSFFPFLEQWKETVNEYDYQEYFLVTLEYSPKMLMELDEEAVIKKARNEFSRIATSIISAYGKMDGRSSICSSIDVLEALYFATHKRNASISNFRKLLDENGINIKDGALSNIIVPDFDQTDRDALKVIEDLISEGEYDWDAEEAQNEVEKEQT